MRSESCIRQEFFYCSSKLIKKYIFHDLSQALKTDSDDVFFASSNPELPGSCQVLNLQLGCKHIVYLYFPWLV